MNPGKPYLMLLLMLKRPWTWMMSVRRGWLACAAFALMSHPAYAADLLGAYRQALENDANFLAARANAAAAREAVPQARAGLLPNLSLSASRSKNYTDITQNTLLGRNASSFDYICDNCGATDEVPGGWGALALPCPNPKPKVAPEPPTL